MSDDSIPGGSAGYYGQLGLNDGASQFNVMAAVIATMLGRVRTMVVVKVMAVTNEGGVSAVGFVDVMPLVKQVDGVGKATSHGTIFNMPYFRVQGGANAIIIDPKVDDLGIAIIADRDSSSVKENKAESTPGSKRRFDLADGVYIGGILNGVPDQYVQFTDDGIKVADKNGNVLNMTSSGIALTGNLTVTGTITATGEIQKGSGLTKVTLGSHQHSANNTPPTPGH